MGGVDLSDQMLEPYNAARKTMTWYKKLFVHMLQLSMLNACIIYKQADRDPKLSFLDFNTAVVSELLLHESADDDNENVVRLTGHHFIAKIESTAKARPQKIAECAIRKGFGRRADINVRNVPLSQVYVWTTD